MSRTGTKSLNRALQLLGYNTVHLPSKLQLLSGTAQAFGDIPCYAYLPQLLLLYPNAVLLCTVRDKQSWLISCAKHFRATSNPYFLELRNLVYGNITFDYNLWSLAYDRHLNTVNTLPVTFIPIDHPDKWSILCDSLNKPLPRLPYPHYP